MSWEVWTEIGRHGFLGTFPLLLILGLALWLILRLGLNAKDETRAATTFALILVFAGLLATLGPELFRIVDVFGNRMNTVFKFYYQAWILLAAASAFGVYYLVSGWDWSGIYRRTVGTVAVGADRIVDRCIGDVYFGCFEQQDELLFGRPDP